MADQNAKALLEAFIPIKNFSKALIDAYVLLDKSGVIIKFNHLYNVLTGYSPRSIKSDSKFDDTLNLNIQGENWDSKKLLALDRPTRIDEVSGKNEHKDSLNLIISVFPFRDEKNGDTLGSLIMLRDVTAETNLQDKFRDTAIKSITDPLTTLFTRSYLEEYLANRENVQKRLAKNSESRNLTIIILDIDHFKNVNDTYGHLAGDYVIRELSVIMKNQFRKSDVICRFGGEEFIIALPATNLMRAMVPAEKFRQAIEEHIFTYDGQEIPVTISLGIAQVMNWVDEDYHHTIARADLALYNAKNSGRNRVSIHDGNTVLPLP